MAIRIDGPGRTCGIRGAGDLYCWGINQLSTWRYQFAKLGLGDDYEGVEVVPTPTRLGTDSGLALLPRLRELLPAADISSPAERMTSTNAENSAARSRRDIRRKRAR